ncbi:IPExxxVDY family protein [Fulvivirga sediminis]|uniref:IPExxxVDY family protein n=1 Tax=Fulvivirga sediminis TaxID=2803949 RepID=A0A937F7X6_9BACT|nr:IPExxxVDY family protein [Fulvivirga sediminis]MBL3657966.1 IPExxxVDY family protein [Fulvivirga sediminis]
MKKTKLFIEHVYDFDLLGVISSVRFYKMAWCINKTLSVRLKKEEDISLEVKNERTSLFGNYIFENESCYLQLYKNKSLDGENAYLIPEMQHYDYLIKSSLEYQSFAAEEIIKALKEVTWIEYIAAIEVNNLKSKDNFLT